MIAQTVRHLLIVCGASLHKDRGDRLIGSFRDNFSIACPVNVHVREQVMGDLTEQHGCTAASILLLNIRLVNHAVDHHFGILNRREADKGKNELPLVTGPLLCRTGLTADGIAFHLGTPAGTVNYHTLKHLTHLCRGLFGYGPADQYIFIIRDQVSCIVHHPANDVGLIIIPAVDDGAECGSQLEHGNTDGLTECGGCKLRLIQLLLIVNQIGKGCIIHFSGNVDIRPFSETEDGLCLVICGTSHQGTDLHESVITGIRQTRRKILHTVTIMLGTEDVVIRNLLMSIAVERIRIRHHSVFQSAGQHKGLIGRTRFEGIADHEAAPQGVQLLQFLLFLILAGFQLDLVLFELLLAHIRIHVLHAVQIEGIVGIILMGVVKRQNLARLGTHDQNGNVLRIQLALYLFRILLHDPLDLQIDGCNDVVPIRRRFRCPNQIISIIQIRVGPAVAAVQLVVIASLQAAQTFISTYHKAQQMAGQFLVGIHSDVVFLEPHADHVIAVVGIPELLELLHLVIGKSLFRHAVKGLCVFQIACQLFPVHAEVFHDGFRGGLGIFLFLQNMLRLYDQIINLIAGGKCCSVTVQNVSPSIRNREAVIVLLAQHFLFVFRTIGAVDVDQSSRQEDHGR